jgi:hypothetical protein
VALLQSASKIVLQPTGDLSGLEIKLAAVPAHTIRGVVLNPDGTPAAKAAITLGEDQDPRGHPVFAPGPSRSLKVESNSDGAFEFPQVADGEWRIAAKVESGGEDLRGAQWIEMAGHELEGVKLRLALPFTLRGRVVMEVPKGMAAPEALPIFLVPQGRSLRSDTGMSNWMLWPEYHFTPFPLPEIVPDLLSGELGAIRALPRG